MEYSPFLSRVGRWRRVVIASSLLAALAGALVTFAIPPTYEGNAVVLVGSALSSAAVDREQLEVSQQLTETYAAIANSRPLLERVASRVGVDLNAIDVRVTSEQDPPVINVTALGRSAEEAAAIANAVVSELIEASPSHGEEEEQSREFVARQLDILEQEIDGTNQQIDELLGLTRRSEAQEEQLAAMRLRLTNLQATYASLLTASSRRGSNALSVLEEALPVDDPVAPQPALNAGLAGLVGLSVSLVFILLRERLQETIQTSEDAEGTLGLPTLGSIPRLPVIGGRISVLEASATGGNMIGREAFRALQANIELLAGSSLTSLVVTSASPGDGKTTVAVNLAASFATGGRQVVVVDADLGHPAVHRHFGSYRRYGVADFLRSTDRDPTSLVQATEVEHLRILPAGQTALGGMHLIGSARMRDLIHTLTSMADLVIIDAPSIIGVAETAVLSTWADATLLVINAGATRAPVLQAARDALTTVGAPIVGSALNDSRGTQVRSTSMTPWASRTPAERAVRERGT